MSIALVTQVMRMRMKSQTEKLILLAFAEHSGDDELSYPSVDLVAAEALCSGRTVQRVIKQFIDNGLLRVGRRASGRGYPTGYRVCPEALGPIPEYAELREAQRDPARVHGNLENAALSTSTQQADLLDDLPPESPVDNSQKGDTQMSPFPPVDNFQKGDKSSKRGDKFVQKGDTLMSPEPRTFNHKERSGDRPVDNFRAGGAQAASDQDHHPPKKHTHPDHSDPHQYLESLQTIEDKARKHALRPRQKWENEFAFRNRVNTTIVRLATLINESRRLRIKNRQPGEGVDDFEWRVTQQALRSKGMASDLSPAQARKQALGISDNPGISQT